METVVVQINNKQAFKLFKNLEELNIIKVLQRIPHSQVKAGDENTDSAKRLAEIQAVTKNINIDLSHFHFNRDDANNYDE